MRFVVLALILAGSCKPQYKKCNCESKDEVQKAYSEIVNEIVEHQTYNYYLDEERIFEAYVKSHGDSSIGTLRLSRIAFNSTMNKGMMYFELAG